MAGLSNYQKLHSVARKNACAFTGRWCLCLARITFRSLYISSISCCQSNGPVRDASGPTFIEPLSSRTKIELDLFLIGPDLCLTHSETKMCLVGAKHMRGSGDLRGLAVFCRALLDGSRAKIDGRIGEAHSVSPEVQGRNGIEPVDMAIFKCRNLIGARYPCQESSIVQKCRYASPNYPSHRQACGQLDYRGNRGLRLPSQTLRQD